MAGKFKGGSTSNRLKHLTVVHSDAPQMVVPVSDPIRSDDVPGNGGWGWLFKRVINDGHIRDLKESDVKVYLAIVANSDHKANFIYQASYTRLSQLTGCHTSNVCKAAKRLESHGLISITTDMRGGNTYQVLMPRTEAKNRSVDARIHYPSKPNDRTTLGAPTKAPLAAPPRVLWSDDQGSDSGDAKGALVPEARLRGRSRQGHPFKREEEETTSEDVAVSLLVAHTFGRGEAERIVGVYGGDRVRAGIAAVDSMDPTKVWNVRGAIVKAIEDEWKPTPPKKTAPLPSHYQKSTEERVVVESQKREVEETLRRLPSAELELLRGQVLRDAGGAMAKLLGDRDIWESPSLQAMMVEALAARSDR